jgi:hypothetical protein
MTTTIKLVANDTRPFVYVTLKDQDGNIINLAGVSAVKVYFREVGESAVLATINAQIYLPSQGKVMFDFSGGVLNGLDGNYEGEIEIEFSPGVTQTVFKPLKFFVRPQFA